MHHQIRAPGFFLATVCRLQLCVAACMLWASESGVSRQPGPALSYESTAFVPVGAAGCVGLRELLPTMSKAAFAEVQKKLVDTQKQYHPPWVIMD
eukprot:COSAG01_NODE_1370_length_10548_cov_8.861422_3_plen_95_part_00